MWKGYHLSIEGIWKGDLFCEKRYICKWVGDWTFRQSLSVYNFVKKIKAEKNFASFQLCRCHAVNVSDNAAYFYNKINEDLRRGGIDVKAEDIIDIIDGYKGGGYGVSTQHELGG